LAVGELGYEDAEREVEGGAGGGEHDGGAGFGIAEDEEPGGRHGEAGGCGFAGVVDEGEELDAFGGEEGLEAGDGFVYGEGRGAGLDAGLHGGLPV
jgi:hypothetical protein